MNAIVKDLTHASSGTAPEAPEQVVCSMVEAVTLALRHAMREDPSVVLLGEHWP